ncbi:MAG: hypothetical protein Ta2G_07770 [Termitinemataceae bacterium]|nr:MAG: hypothetical protein Ta2G_07770 [Termitinemataceae bacterium]
MDKTLKNKILPFSLTVFIIVLDQITKYLITKAGSIGAVISDVFGNDFLCIWHVRNKVIAFSLGNSLPEMLRPLVFIALPIVVLTLLLIYYFRTNDFSKLQCWAVTGIVGGGGRKSN